MGLVESSYTVRNTWACTFEAQNITRWTLHMLQHLTKGTAAQAQKLATRSDSSSDLGIGTSLKDGGEKIARNQAWTRYHMWT